MNLLDLVPSLQRQVGQYINEEDTDSKLAGYIADAIDALNWRWLRHYVISQVLPNTYNVTPDIKPKDIRPVILMAGIIYKMGNVSLVSFRDGDFAWDPVHVRVTPLTNDVDELNKIVPIYPKLISGFTAPIRGYANIYSPESYNFLLGMGFGGGGFGLGPII